MGKEKKISTAKTDAEYRARAKKWYYSHGNSMTGFEATEGIYYKADGTKVKIRTALAFDKKTNTRKPESQRSFTLADAENQASVTTRRKAKEKVPERLRSKFPSDESFEGFKQYVKQGFASNQAKRKALNAYYKKHNIIDPRTGRIKNVDLGHVSSYGNKNRPPELVGSNDPMSQRIEIATGPGGNRATAAHRDVDPNLRRAAGYSVNWDDSADHYLSSEHRAKFEILTPQDQQRIMKGESPDEVFAQRRAAIEANPKASAMAHNRKRMAGYTKALKIGLKGVGLAALPSAFDLITPNSASSATEKLMGGKQGTSWGTIGGEFLEEAKNNYVQGLPLAVGAGLLSAAGGGAALSAAAPVSLLIGGGAGSLALADAVATGFTRGAGLDNSIPSGRVYNPDRTARGEIFLQEPEIQVVNQQHRDFAREMEAKTSQTAATKLGNAVEKWATNPLNEIKYGYQQLLNFTKHFR